MKNTPLTSEQQQVLISKYADTSNKELAALVGCTLPQVKYLAKTAGLHKTAAHVSAVCSAKKKTPAVNKAPKRLPKPKKQAKPEAKEVKRPWHYPVSSPEYQEWMQSKLVGTRTPILDANGRTAYVYRRNG